MSTKFFTNQDENTLFNKLNGVFEHNQTIKHFDVLVGYFRSSGYFKLRPLLENIDKIRILVGIDVDKLTNIKHFALSLLAMHLLWYMLFYSYGALNNLSAQIVGMSWQYFLMLFLGTALLQFNFKPYMRYLLFLLTITPIHIITAALIFF